MVCEHCRFYRKDGSFAIPAPPDVGGHDCWETGPHCEHDPEWIRIQDPEYHYCAYWQAPLNGATL
jgi:hypothetical protein